jgi:hypothetical protein
VSLVEAKPNLAGTPWLEPGKTTTAQASVAPATQPATQPGSATGASKPD